MKTVKYKGDEYVIKKSDRKGKQLMAIDKSGSEVHFGDPTMDDFPGTKRLEGGLR